LTCETATRDIISHQQRAFTNTIQLVDELSEGAYDDLRKALPATKLVQVIHVRDARSVEEALKISDHVDALLLDSGNPALAVKELGGTGRVHDWGVSRRVVEASPVPVFLAGGLRAE